MDKSFILLVVIMAGISFTVWMSTRSVKYKKKKKNAQKKDINFLQTTTAWEKVGKLKNIWIYPVKSCAGISLAESTIERQGLKLGAHRDRSFIIVDKDGQMITGRKVYATLLIHPKFDTSDDDIITLSFSGLQELEVSMKHVESEGRLAWTKFRDERVCGYDCGDEASVWLSVALKREGCRLLYHGLIPPQRSMEKLVKDYSLINGNDSGLYSDLSPYMLMTESSISDIGKKASRPNLPPQNFRPNLLVEGTSPYDEDDWTYIKIGDAILHFNKPCERCIFPTIDYRTGKRDPYAEPLKTLKKYRHLDGPTRNPCLGIDLGVDAIGRVRLGDAVYVLRED